MKTGIFSKFCFGILAISVIMGILTRLSYTDYQGKWNSEDKNNYKIDIIEYPDTVDPISITELKDTSDVIVKVQLTENKEYLNQCILSEVIISEVYKGDDVKSGQTIKIYEPSFYFSSHDTYVSYEGYNLMAPDIEYIFFLNRLEYPNGSFGEKPPTNEYILTSNTYGKYNLSGNINLKLITNPEEIIYKDIKNYELITGDENILENYTNFRNRLIEKIN